MRLRISQCAVNRRGCLPAISSSIRSGASSPIRTKRFTVDGVTPSTLAMSEPLAYLTKLLANGAVKSYIGRHEPEILTHLELVVNTVSMEEAVQQQLAETAEAAQ